MKKAIAMLLATVMCTAMLTGCGSDSATNESSQAAESSVAETAVATTEAADKTEGGVLVFGTNAEFPPFEYVGDDGEPDGFDVALIKAVGEKLGMEVQVENMEFDSLVSSIGNRIDGAIAGMTVTDDRKEQVDFSDPYYEAVQFVIVPADSDIATADDLKNKTIGSQLGTTGMFLSEDIEGVTAQTYNRAIDAVNDLVNGRVDAVIIDKNPAEVFNTKFEGKVKIIDGAEFGFETEEYAIALPKGSELVDQINQALEDLKADGTFDALVAQYIGE
jgi:amino acid ABC transporter substrate-binding protein